MNEYQYGYENFYGSKFWFRDHVEEDTARSLCPASASLIRRKLSESEIVGPKLPKTVGSVVTYLGSFTREVYTAVRHGEDDWRSYRKSVAGALLRDADLVDLGFTIIHEAE